jgi:signal transduction histidine kinase
MAHKNKSLKDLLLIHELAFILLIVLSAVAGVTGIHLWETSSQESGRINSLVQEVQQTRGDLYRQMKELFDAYFLDDAEAHSQYDGFTRSVEAHFVQLKQLAEDAEEQAAIRDLHTSYRQFVYETSDLFNQSRGINNDATRNAIRQALDTGLEAGLFKRYEEILARTEKLLVQKQAELDAQLKITKRISLILLTIPLILAVLLLIFSRLFLKRAIVQPINGVLQATSEISTGNLNHRAPEAGVEELATVSRAINEMADMLIVSQETLVRTEKQAAQGLLVPMLAHNIRNPLASIRATAQVIEVPDQDHETRESVTGIISTVDRLERWTGALLAYLHPLKPQPNQTTVAEIIEGAMSPLQQKIKEKAIQLKVNLIQDSKIFTDQHLLEQVIYNLLLNAIDASAKNSMIEIQLENNHEQYRLSLIDNGCGMPFMPDPSTTTLSPTTKRFGTGLGIPFAYKVCDALGAQLTFMNRPAGGTVITISLPKALTV